MLSGLFQGQLKYNNDIRNLKVNVSALLLTRQVLLVKLIF